MKDIFATPSKYRVVIECLRPCLEEDKLEVAQICCIRDACDHCGFSNLWYGDLRDLATSSTTPGGRSLLVAGSEWIETKLHW